MRGKGLVKVCRVWEKPLDGDLWMERVDVSYISSRQFSFVRACRSSRQTTTIRSHGAVSVGQVPRR